MDDSNAAHRTSWRRLDQVAALPIASQMTREKFSGVCVAATRLPASAYCSLRPGLLASLSIFWATSCSLFYIDHLAQAVALREPPDYTLVTRDNRALCAGCLN